MKKNTFILTVFSVLSILLSAVLPVSFVSASEQNSDVVTEIVGFDDLPEYEKNVFLEAGLTTEDDFFKTVYEQPISNTDSGATEISPAFIDVNVVTVYGHTKRVASNRAESIYTINSSKVPLVRIDMQTKAAGGGITRYASSTKYTGAYNTTMSTFVTYSGASNYFNFTGTAQVTTTLGTLGEPLVAKVGGTTLGY